MSIFNGMNISSSALTAQRLRMDTVSANIANADSTRARINEDGEFEPYRRKIVNFHSDSSSFRDQFSKIKGDENKSVNGVKVASITEDDAPFVTVYNPNHPDADEAGYVQMPNVDPLQEMVDLMSATRSYEANVTAFNATKGMLMKALEIGK
ncbi:flagellar basal-body rod protein FlgC [Halolactibacillus halophilus]|uniref:Flagellar basal-body rod protein FlgC n=1 Tax=Halolactibacillus halophilus TaxID=306540 RepID=A0A1I5LLS4_9BACI|nr:flagellar basal body rod protein FlgC [Halolactibacillus halophilus]GEM00765.1 flagellar basal-body rod protein FlgC [Halolactibacillus halophilus]SFO98152.1 flagellar basal-body rod protein FlgC [Halolactibacillus halophilus]